jgi:outer membrane receptor protein involved in Fe transport
VLTASLADFRKRGLVGVVRSAPPIHDPNPDLPMKTLFRKSSHRLTFTALCVCAGHLFAQQTTPTDAPETPTPNLSVSNTDVLQLESLVVTGTAMPITKFDSAFSISTLSEFKIERLAPQSSVDLVRSLPGFWTEPSGGEGGNNLAVRGLPSSNFRFVGFFEDGLPNFQEQQQSYLNADELLRVDATIEGVEAVRGGTASIFSSNSPGANINFITRKGGETREGLARLTVTDFGQLRWDGVLSGPVAGGLSASLGGFYRIGDGQRDAGFTGDKGGQLRLSLTQKFDQGTVTAYVRALRDRNLFYLPIPLKDPRNPAVSLAGLIDPHTGTLTSDDFRYARLRTLNGAAGGRVIDADLADGIHSNVTSMGVIANFKLGDGWRLTNHFRQVSGDVDFNALFSTTAPDDAASYLASQLSRAKAAWTTATSARYVLANSRTSSGGRIVFDPTTTNGLVIRGGWYRIETSFANALDDLRLNKKFETAHGIHELSVGLYFSDYSTTQYLFQNTNLMELRSRPRALDIEALDASGAVVGSVTENGFVQYGTAGDPGGYAEGRIWAPYLAETWKVNRALTIDTGLRVHRQKDRGYALLRTTQNLGNTATLADDNVGGPSGQVESRTANYHATSWTLGANYEFNKTIALFARGTSTFRTPNLQNIYQRRTVPVTNIKEAELGLKYNSRHFSAFGTVFANQFSPLLENITTPDALGVFRTYPFTVKTETRGVELEATWSPVAWFELSGNGTLQQPMYKQFINATTGAPVPDVPVNNQIGRIPKKVLNIQPRVFFGTWGQRSEAYLSYYYAGERFVDSANKTAMPAYTTLDAGITLRFSERLSLQLVGSNLTNSAGLTEGNPRVDTLIGQGTREATYGRPIFGRSFKSVFTYRF